MYRDQGVSIHDKHIELIVRQMTRRVGVQEPGDSRLPARRAGRRRRSTPTSTGSWCRRARRRPRAVPRSWASPRRRWPPTRGCRRRRSRRRPVCSPRRPSSRRSDGLLGLKENIIIGKLIPAGTGMEVVPRRSRPRRPTTSRWSTTPPTPTPPSGSPASRATTSPRPAARPRPCGHPRTGGHGRRGGDPTRRGHRSPLRRRVDRLGPFGRERKPFPPGQRRRPAVDAEHPPAGRPAKPDRPAGEGAPPEALPPRAARPRRCDPAAAGGTNGDRDVSRHRRYHRLGGRDGPAMRGGLRPSARPTTVSWRPACSRATSPRWPRSMTDMSVWCSGWRGGCSATRPRPKTSPKRCSCTCGSSRTGSTRPAAPCARGSGVLAHHRSVDRVRAEVRRIAGRSARIEPVER